MTLTPKDVVEFINRGEKTREEICGVVDRIVASIEEEIAMLGNQRASRQERHAKALAASMAECDERADFLIRRKDLMAELKARMAGETEEISPEMLELPAPDKRPGRGEPGRKKRKFLGFGKAQTA